MSAESGTPNVTQHVNVELYRRLLEILGRQTISILETAMTRASTARKSAPPAAAARFIKLDAKGNELPSDADGHVAVFDRTSGLIWQTGDSEKRLTHKQAEAYVKKLNLLGKKDWRLPTVEELFLLADRTKTDPAIDRTLFPTCKSSWYWTGTLYAASHAVYAWLVYFNCGSGGWLNRDYDYFVRAVRPSQF